MKSNVLAGIVGLTLSLSAQAQTSPANQDMARCAAVESGVKRLECYDAISKKLGVDGPKVETKSVGKWRVQEEVSPIDDSKNVFLSLAADTPISGWMKKNITPVLQIRCKEKKTEVLIITQMSASVESGRGQHTVTLRFDKNKATQYLTTESTDREALFFGQSSTLAKTMMASKTMLFEFVPHNASPAMTTFNLEGLSEAIAPARKVCGW